MEVDYFKFTRNYRDIVRKIEEKHKAAGVCVFMNTLMDYALDGTEPNLKELPGWMNFVWKNTKPLVDESKTASAIKKDKSENWKHSGRELSDLSEDELESLGEMYRDHINYSIIRERFKMRNYSLTSNKIEKALMGLYGKQLKKYFWDFEKEDFNEEHYSELRFICDLAEFEDKGFIEEEIYKAGLPPKKLIDCFYKLDVLLSRAFYKKEAGDPERYWDYVRDMYREWERMAVS